MLAHEVMPLRVCSHQASASVAVLTLCKGYFYFKWSIQTDADADTGKWLPDPLQTSSLASMLLSLTLTLGLNRPHIFHENARKLPKLISITNESLS